MLYRWGPFLTAVAAGMLSFVTTAHARPTALGTAITYQGQLKSAGSPFSGAAEFQFRLYDAVTGGNQIGSQIALIGGNAPTVSNGLFTVSLDFGAAAYGADARWLEIDVRTGLGSFTTLSPRQALSAVPFALQTRGLFVDNAGNVGIGTTTPGTPVHIASDLNCVLMLQDTGPASTQSGFVTYRNNAGTETGWVGYGTPGSPHFSMVNARTSGDIEISSFSGNIRLATNVQALTILSGGNVGIGTTSPSFQLDVVDTGAGNTFAIRGDGTQVGVEGHSVNSSGTAVLGICDNASGFDFFAAGAGVNYGAPSSIRWKRNIELIDDPLLRIEQVRGVTYDWDAEHGGQHDVGFIGEEVGKVLPEVVVYEADGQFVTGMDYSKMTPLLVEAVKALRAEKDQQILELQERAIQQQATIDDLHERLQRLERLAGAATAAPRQ